MSKKEKIKAKLDLFKTLIVTLLTALFGILGYSVLNYQNFTEIVGVSVAIGVFVLLLSLVVLGKQFSIELDKLEKED